MDHDNNKSNDDQLSAVPPPPPPASAQPAPPDPASPTPAAPVPVYIPAPSTPKKNSYAWKFLRYIFIVALVGSIILNCYLIAFVSQGLHEQTYLPGDEKQKIALIDVQGSINMKAATQLRRMLRRAGKDDNVKAVILVINSPGGLIVPSAMANKYVGDFKKEYPNKKIYASIQQVGASGAYWIATAAEKVYANTNAVIGSIGVIYINFVVEQTLKEKLGIEPIIIVSSGSPNKDRGSPFRMPTEQEKLEVIHDLDTIHERFIEAVSIGRGISMDDARLIATGDVFDGPEALEKKMIDKIGFLDDAIDDIAKELSLSDPHVVRFVRPPTVREMLTATSEKLNSPMDIQKQLEKLASTPRIQAIWLGN